MFSKYKTMLDFGFKCLPIVTTIFLSIAAAIGFASATRYYNQFNIQFSEVAGFLDYAKSIFYIPGGLFLAFDIILAIIFIAGFIYQYYFLKTLDKKSVTHRFIVTTLTLLSVIFLIVFGFVSNKTIVKKDVDGIKSGYWQRLNVYTSSQELKCVSMIGGTAKHNIFWDSNLEKSILIQKNSMESIVIVTEMPPFSFDCDNRKEKCILAVAPGSSGRYYRLPTQREISDWVMDASKKCSNSSDSFRRSRL